MTSQPEGAVSGQIGRDAGVIALLACALAAVYLYDRSTPEPPDPDVSVVVRQVVPAVPSSTPSKPLRLAITPPEFDDMGKLLDQLGKGYRYDVIQLEDLTDEGTLDSYDVVFLTCGTVPESWLQGSISEGPRNTIVRQLRLEIVQRLRRNLRDFVEEGGTLYASDWRYQLLRLAFPESTDPSEQGSGASQELTAKVVDEGLKEHIGDTIHLRFDLGGWFPAIFTTRDLQTYLEGDFATEEGGRASRPLLVKFPFGEGNIIYTSFHNEKQNSATELELLKFLVFTTVTARIEASVTKTMMQGGFSPQKQNMLSASEDAPSISKTYECAESGRIQFVLAFEDRGAELELIVTSPSGRTHEKVGSSTLNVDIENAEVGNWEYSIRAKKVPYPNFPFTLTVWQQ